MICQYSRYGQCPIPADFSGVWTGGWTGDKPEDGVIGYCEDHYRIMMYGENKDDIGCKKYMVDWKRIRPLELIMAEFEKEINFE